MFLNESTTQKNMWNRHENINLVPEMHKITVPSLIMWGRHDGILPVEIAYEAYDKIGSSNKYLQIFEYSGHFTFYEEPDLFIERVRTFINKYK
jgi:pimeloyl-ACP methyl ester carboxylesterase